MITVPLTEMLAVKLPSISSDAVAPGSVQMELRAIVVSLDKVRVKFGEVVSGTTTGSSSFEQDEMIETEAKRATILR